MDVLVVGGGIVGLATAHAVARTGRSVAVVEREPRLAAHQTGNNSNVIHSGLYYAPGGYKARLAVAGCAETVAFCRAHDLPHEVTGKLVVATEPEELPRLAELKRRGDANGVETHELDPTGIRHMLSSLPDPGPMPADLVDRINASIAHEESARGVRPVVVPLRRRSVWPKVAVAAAAVAVVGVGVAPWAPRSTRSATAASKRLRITHVPPRSRVPPANRTDTEWYMGEQTRWTSSGPKDHRSASSAKASSAVAA